MKPKPTTPGSVNWEERPLEWPRAANQLDRLLAALEVRRKRQRRRRLAASGGAVALLVVGLVGAFALSSPPTASLPLAPSGTALVTAPERRTLPDGSTVELKPGAEIALDFSADFRRVELVKGEAHFQVAKNPQRPFIAKAGGVQFRAVGTAFSIDLGSNSVEMLVTEGRVAVETTAAPHSTTQESARAPIATVDAGNRVVVEIAAPDVPAVVPTTLSETAGRLAWRVPRLEFNETPLWEVVHLLNEHSGRRISLANPELRRLEISGALRANNIEPLLQTLEENYRIHVVRRPSGEIDLQPARR